MAFQSTETTLLDLFNTGAGLNPDRIAITYDDGEAKRSLTYASLKLKVTLVTEELKLLISSEVVGIIMKPGCYVPVVILGILTVPATFYSIDPSNTRAVDFLLHVTHRLNLKAFIVEKSLSSFVEILVVAGCTDIEVHELKCLDLLVVTAGHSSCIGVISRPVCLNHSYQFAYAITTSGTTGVPKIVCVPNKCIVPNIIHISNIYKLSSSDVVFQASPMTFDPSIVEIFTTFYVGATLLIVPDKIRMMPSELASYLTQRNHVTVIQATPTLISNIGAAVLQQTLLCKNTSLRVLCFGGECCPSGSTLKLWRQDGNDTTFMNIYGVTEVSCWATLYCLTDDDLQSGNGDIPLGNALDGTELEVRNVDIAGIGELWIGGHDRVCKINDEESTSARNMRFSGDLVKLTADGIMCYRGRRDDMVKRNGKRFHLQEIEKVVKKNRNVNQAVVLYAENRLLLFIQLLNNKIINSTEDMQVLHSSRSEKNDSLLADDHIFHTLTNNDDRSLTSDDLTAIEIEDIPTTATFSSKHLISDVLKEIELWLPTHCHPDNVIVVNHMPFTHHGKADKKRLLHWFNSQLSICKPSSGTVEALDIRKIICELWKNYITTANIVKFETSSFIDCGGTSLSAVCLAEDISHALNSDKEVMLLVDKILHGSLDDVVCYLCDVLTGGDDAVGHEISAMSDDVSVTGKLLENDTVNDVTHSKSTEIVKRSKRLSTISEYDRASKRMNNAYDSQEYSRDPIKTKAQEDSRDALPDGETNSEQIFSGCPKDDENALYDRPIDHSKDISEVDNSMSCILVCRCLSQSTPSNKLWSVSRGSSRISCCHSRSNSTKIKTSQLITSEHKYCILNKFQACVRTCEVIDNISLKVAWKHDTGKCIDASPLIVHDSLNRGYVYIGSHSHRFVALSLETGLPSWDITVGGRIESSAAVSRCQQFLIVGCYDSKVYVINRLSGEISWCFETHSQVKCSPCVDPKTGIVYIGSHDACLYALDVQKCTCLWKKDLRSGSLFSSPCLSLCPYQLVIGTLGGLLVAVNPDSGNILWKYNAGKPLFSSPVPFQSGYVVGCVDNNVYAVSHTGFMLWRLPTGGPVFSTACVFGVSGPCTFNITTSGEHQSAIIRDEEIVLFGSHDSNVYCLRAQDGVVLWKTTLDSQVYSTPFAWNCCSKSDSRLCSSKCLTTDAVLSDVSCGEDAYAVTCSIKGYIYILKLSTGQIVAQFVCGNETFSSPVLSNNRLVIGCRDNNVYSLCFQ